MGKVNVESSFILSELGNSIDEIKVDMQDNLSILNNAFATACENWKDKNAQACDNALREHSTAMNSAFSRLEKLENAINRLSKIASEYEEI